AAPQAAVSRAAASVVTLRSIGRLQPTPEGQRGATYRSPPATGAETWRSGGGASWPSRSSLAGEPPASQRCPAQGRANPLPAPLIGQAPGGAREARRPPPAAATTPSPA